jgi:hypothetical protein
MGSTVTASIANYRCESPGVVGDDAVHTEIEKAVHFGGVVDRPDVHLDPPGVCEFDQRCVDERLPAEFRRDLQCHRARRRVGPGSGAAQELVDVALTRTLGDRSCEAAEAAAKPRHDPVISRGQKGDRLSPMLRNEFQRCVDQPEPRRLEIQIETGIREVAEGFFEARNPHVPIPIRMGLTAIEAEVVAGIEAPQLVRGEIGDASRSVRYAIDDCIVNQDRDAVAGQVDVTFEHAGTLGQRALERGYRVFGRLARAAPMRDRDRPWKIEVGVCHGG